LVSSTNKKNKCECGRHEYYCCPDLKCTRCICNKCFDALDNAQCTFIDNNINEEENIDTHNNNNNEINNGVNEEDDEEYNSDELLEPEPSVYLNEDDGEYMLEDNGSDHADNAINYNTNSDEDENSNDEDDDFMNLQNRFLPTRESDILLERDDIDNYVTTAFDPDLPAIDEEDHLQEVDGQINFFPSTNTGEYALNV
jgi:hypothetical protein